jgi:hypothetical protein
MISSCALLSTEPRLTLPQAGGTAIQDLMHTWDAGGNLTQRETVGGQSDTTAPSAVSNLAADTPTSNSLTLTWTAPGYDGNNGTAILYDIRYSTSAINAGNWASATQCTGEPTPLVAGSAQSFLVSGLNSSTTYYFVIKTADEVWNWSGISNCPSGSTTAGGGGTQTENFGYDFLDRLTSVSGAYSESYSYNQIGNMLTRNGVSYTYPTNGVRPHAVSSVGSTSYLYDNNGNMTTRGTQTLTWDVENRPLTVIGGASFIYNGDGNRVKKTEGGQTILYVNKYYDKNLITGEVTTYYCQGDRLVTKMTNSDPNSRQFIHQDHLTGSSAVSSSAGALVNSIKYLPFGATRSGDVPTDKKFTGQRLDGTLYSQLEDKYREMIGDPNMSAEERGALQTLHDSPGITLQFDRYGPELDKMLAGVSDLARRLPTGDPERAAKWGRTVYYDWNPQSTYLPFRSDHWLGRWNRDYAGSREPVEMDWGGLGRAAVGSAGLVTGTGFVVAGGVLSLIGIVPGPTIALSPAGPTFLVGWAIYGLTVQWMTGGERKMPDFLPPNFP